METSPLIEPGRQPELSAESLRWAMGLFCAFIGAFMLVAPHRYAGPLYDGLRPFQQWWGMAALGGGTALLAVAILRPGRAASLLVHGITGATLLVLAASFLRTGAWTGAVSYSIVGAGVALAGLLPRTGSLSPNGVERDLFALLMGAVAVLNGALLVALPQLFRNPIFEPGRRYLPFFGAALVVSGTLLCRVHLRAAPRWLTWTAHLASGAVFLLLGLLVSLPGRSWTGIVFYIGCGAALTVLPWLSRRLAHLDTQALRTRLALALAIATSVALVLTAAIATSQEERLAIQQVKETRDVEADSIAGAVADFVDLNAAETATIASLAGRELPAPLAQRRFLETALPVYPRMTALVSLDRDGRVLAATGSVPLDAVDWRDLAASVIRRQRMAVQLLHLPGEPLPQLVFACPVTGPDGGKAGVLVSVLRGGELEQKIARPGSNVYLADGHGRMIADKAGAAPEAGAPGLPLDGWDQSVAAGRTPAGHPLVAFQAVRDLGWAVAVERPRSTALGGVRQGRDLAFGLLLLVVPMAVLAGIFTARRIARPLGTLADAVGELTAGNPGAPLGTSSISEVARLSAAFAEMRDRLAARTRESERLAGELRARAEALADSDRRKNEFLAMLAHELRNPLGAIANATWVLSEAGSLEPPMDRSVAVIQRQIQHLVRLVDDLLDVSRITRGKVELRRERVDLADVVRNAVETMRPLVEAKSHELTVDLPPEPLPLDADGTRLEQVVGNLLRNSAKYTDPGGHIEISVHREGGEAVLCVRDDGVGIAPDLLPRVFDLFTQGQQGLDRAGAGLGIGLTLVRNLVEMHGGRVEAQSAGTGAGCTIEVRLPLLLVPLNTSPPDRS